MPMQDYHNGGISADRDTTFPRCTSTQVNTPEPSLHIPQNGNAKTGNSQFFQEHHVVTDAQEPDRTYHPCCQHPINSAKRRKCMDNLWRELEPQINRFSFPEEFLQEKGEVIQQVALYFSRNLCPGPNLTAKQPYNPDTAQVTTWLNSYWEYRIKDLYRNRAKEGKNRQEQRDKDGNVLDPEDYIPTRPSVPDLIQVIHAHIQTDATDQLKQIHLPNRKDITAQSVLLTQVPPTISFQELAQNLNVEYQCLYTWYRRHCKPLLRQIGEQYSHLEEGMN